LLLDYISDRGTASPSQRQRLPRCSWQHKPVYTGFMQDTGLIAFLAQVAAPAANSGLIVFLPLVGAVVGAIIGAFANGLYRGRQDKKARNRERNGLLKLIFDEIDSNGLEMKEMKRARTPAKTIIDNLTTDVWDEQQGKLAAELPFEQLQLMTKYYRLVKSLKALPLAKDADLSADEQEIMHWAIVSGTNVMRFTQKYFPEHFRRDHL